MSNLAYTTILRTILGARCVVRRVVFIVLLGL